jgi:hypothetical protein
MLAAYEIVYMKMVHAAQPLALHSRYTAVQLSCRLCCKRSTAEIKLAIGNIAKNR